jgi:hypothetical protein
MRIRRRALVGTLAALVVAGVLALVADRGWSARPPRALEIELAVSAGTFAQVFWGPDRFFAEERSVRVPLQPAPGRFQRLRFPIPSADVPWLRLDPSDTAAEVAIREARVLDAGGGVLARMGPDDVRPLIPTMPLVRDGDVARVVTTAAGERPSVLFAFGCLDRSSSWGRLSRVTPTALTVVAVAALALVAAAVTAARVAPRLAVVGLFLVVFSAKLFFLRSYHVTVAYWDEWVMGADLFRPYHDCSLGWSQMFGLHNEHRVFFTRLLSLALLVVDGQWDPRLQQVVDAAIHALTAGVLAAMLWRASGRRHLLPLLGVCMVTFALPFSWENTLLGLQSSFYFQLLFFVLALWLMTGFRLGTAAWWLGGACATCGLVAAAGGIMTPLAIAGVVAVTGWRDRQAWRRCLAALVVVASILALGVAVASPPLPGHAALKARTAAEFIAAFGRNLAWPWIEHPWVSVVAWLPVASSMLVVWRSRTPFTMLERIVVGLSAWVTLQAAAVAYGRGVGGQAPVPRYQDFLSLGFVANAAALLAIADRLRGSTAQWRVRGAAGSWLCLFVVGLAGLMQNAFHDVNHYRDYWSDYASNIRRFVFTGDLAEFASKRPHREVPYPDPLVLAGMLREPYLRSILPTAVREPVRVQPRLVTDHAFMPDGADPTLPRDPLTRAWGSYTALGAASQGRFESEIVAPCRLGGRLRFLVSGEIGTPSLSLQLYEQGSGRVLDVRPGRPAVGEWVDVQVPCPKGPYMVVAVDQRPDGWLAFREPVEIGWASRVAEALIARSESMLAIALAVTAFAVWQARILR